MKLVALFLLLLSETSVLAIDANQYIGTMNQMQQLEVLKDSRFVRPTPRDREAIRSLVLLCLMYTDPFGLRRLSSWPPPRPVRR